jgi:outer membrane protein assembly factor BamC
MQNMKSKLIGILVTLLALNGCSLFSSQSEYDKVPPGKSLEVPPDLDEPNAAGAVRVPNSTYSRVADGPVSRNAPAGTTTPAVQPGTRMERVNGAPSLLVDDSLESTWRRIGFALERIGLAVEDQQRDDAVYTVEYVDAEAREQRPGAFSRWILRKKGPDDHSGNYLVKLAEVGTQTRVSLLNDEGGRATESVSEEILTGLLERLE